VYAVKISPEKMQAEIFSLEKYPRKLSIGVGKVSWHYTVEKISTEKYSRLPEEISLNSVWEKISPEETSKGVGQICSVKVWHFAIKSCSSGEQVIMSLVWWIFQQ
jgi:hypothetical protein